MAPPIRPLDNRVAVAGQLQPSDLREVAAAGFTVVVNNRPDGEAFFGQPHTIKLQEAAVAAGLTFVDLPFSGTQVSRAQVDAFAALLADPRQRVLAFCKSGMRSTLLWAAAAMAGGRPAQEVVRAAAAAGTDLEPLLPVIGELAKPRAS